MAAGKVLLVQGVLAISAAFQAASALLLALSWAPLAALDPLAGTAGMVARGLGSAVMIGGGGLLIAALELTAALMLFRRDIWGWAGGILGSGLALLSGCLPLGLVGLYVLADPEVRAAYPSGS